MLDSEAADLASLLGDAANNAPPRSIKDGGGGNFQPPLYGTKPVGEQGGPQRGGPQQLPGKTVPTNGGTNQPHSVDSGIGSPRSIPGALYSPNPPKTPKVTGSSPSVLASESSPEK